MTATYPFPVSKDEFRGKRVLVTGGTKGMGQAMVRRFTLSGASVATMQARLYRKNRPLLYSCRRISGQLQVCKKQSAAFSTSGVDSTS